MKILFMLPAAKGVYPDEAAQRRINLIKSYATPATQIDVDYLPDVSGFNPWGGQHDPNHRPAELVARAHSLGAQRALQAEKEGYDAFCPYGAVDVGVQEARNRGLKIPAAGPGEASALFCGLLGRKFASCSYVETPDSGSRDRYKNLGVDHLYVGPTAIGIQNSEYPQRHAEVLDRYKDCARRAREMGAEMMGVIGQSICPTEFSAKELQEATGFPTMDGIAAQVAMVEWWHRTGLPPTLLNVPRH